MQSKNKYCLPVEIKNKIVAYSDTRVHSGVDKYAVDFPLKKRTPILAAREGKIISIKDDSNKGGADEKYTSDEFQNFIIIKHKHEEYTEYIHIDYKSALVKKGDIVKRGQPIAKEVGMVGYTTALHLHFLVFKKTDKNKYGFNSIEINWEESLRLQKIKNQFFSEFNFYKKVYRQTKDKV